MELEWEDKANNDQIESRVGEIKDNKVHGREVESSTQSKRVTQAPRCTKDYVIDKKMNMW